MSARRCVLAAGTLALAVVMTGCSDTNEVVRFEPGQYQGAEDPLLTKLENPEFRAELAARFDGQRDR